MTETRIYTLNEMGALKAHFVSSFYHAFKHLPQTLLRRIWIVDDVKQETTFKTDEKDVFVIPWFVDGKVHAYFAYKEVKSESFSQLNYFGFENHIHSENSIEVLTLFKTNEPISPDINLKRDFLMNCCVKMLVQRGCKFLHATCTEQILPLYLRWDMQVLEVLEIEGLKRFHIMAEF
jgi:hypothetical protein